MKGQNKPAELSTNDTQTDVSGEVYDLFYGHVSLMSDHISGPSLRWTGGAEGGLLNQKKEYGGVISLGPFVFLFLHRETSPRNSEHVTASREDGRGHVTLKLWLVHAPTVRHMCVSDPGTQTRSHIQIHMVPVPPGQQETLGRPLHLLLLHSLGGAGGGL